MCWFDSTVVKTFCAHYISRVLVNNAEFVSMLKVQNDIMDSSCIWAGQQKEYRYVLRRVWDKSNAKIAFIGLNPSIADEHRDDHTVRKCINIAKRDGFGRMVMLNAFAYRSTDPSVLSKANNAIGEANDFHIHQECKGASKIVVAWGKHASGQRHATLLQLLHGRALWCFSVNKDGTPKHPLYVANSSPLIPYSGVL